jgi:archaellum component FlaC
MANIHTETYNAFKQAGVPDEPAQRAAIAVAGEQSAIMEKLNKMEGDIENHFNKMETDIERQISKLEKDLREDIHSLDKKFLIITTIMSSTLPIIGGLLFFVLKAIN